MWYSHSCLVSVSSHITLLSPCHSLPAPPDPSFSRAFCVECMLTLATALQPALFRSSCVCLGERVCPCMLVLARLSLSFVWCVLSLCVWCVLSLSLSLSVWCVLSPNVW